MHIFSVYFTVLLLVKHKQDLLFPLKSPYKINIKFDKSYECNTSVRTNKFPVG